MSCRCLAGVLLVLVLASAGWAVPPLPIVTHDGRPYVELTRVAASIQTKGTPPAQVVATPASTRAQLRAGGKVVTLTRNWSQVLVNGKPVVLDAPVRVKRGVWLVPESFLGRVVPALLASAPIAPVASRLAAAAVEVGLEDVRVRSYPSFTRIVVETSAAVTHRIESSGPKEARVRLKVRPTGDSANFLTLGDRTSFANRQHADLFVSIHANAHREAAADGVETYFLSSEATDSAARQVAALENSAVQLEQPAGRGAAQADIVKAILWDLAQSEFQVESSRLAEVVNDSMTQTLRISSRGVKQAGFYVLGGAAMPAILLEIGFVTNPREERKLKDTKYRDEIARAIFAGLAEYKRTWDQRARAAAETRAVTRTR